MKHINEKSACLMRKLIKGLKRAQDQKRIAESYTFLPVIVELIGKGSAGTNFCFAHYLERDDECILGPELELLQGLDGKFYPIALNHASRFIRKEAVTWDDRGNIKGYYAEIQKELAKIANHWLLAIKFQQCLLHLLSRAQRQHALVSKNESFSCRKAIFSTKLK